jgi:anti-sigma regulatory factor (Ser/Thr protein kinase)
VRSVVRRSVRETPSAGNQKPSTPTLRAKQASAQAVDLRAKARSCRERALVTVREAIAARSRAERALGAREGLAPASVGDGAVSQRLGPRKDSPDYPYSQLQVPAIPDAVRLSRRLVRDLCDLLELTHVADVAELLVGEVTANVVLHTTTPSLRLVVQVANDVLRVCVSDSDPQLPKANRPSDTQPRGRGLFLVESLSKDWGATARPGGKVVWFTLSTHAAAVAQTGQ